MLTGHELLQKVFGDTLAVHGGMTPDLAALYPFFHESGLRSRNTGKKLPGVRVGWCGYERSGGILDYHPGICYDEGLAADRNVILTGRVGNGKSSWAKKFIRRCIAKYNERFLVMDVKGEYGPLIASIPGAKELKVGGETRIYLNPLDPITLESDGNVVNQLSMIGSMAVTLMGDEFTSLSTRQRALLRWGIQDCHEHYAAGDYSLTTGVPVMEMLVDKLFRPTQNMVEGMGKGEDEVKEMGYDMALALQELTVGTLKGMFDQETTKGFYGNTPLLVLNLADLDGIALRLMARTWNYFNSSQYGKLTGAGQFDYVILDETWKLITDPEFVKSLVQSMKLGRSKGKSNILILHRLLSLILAGWEELVNELVNDTSTFISYRQNKALIAAVAELIGFNSSMVQWVGEIAPKYSSMYKVGDEPGIIVEDSLWPEEVALVNTDPGKREVDADAEIKDEEKETELLLTRGG